MKYTVYDILPVPKPRQTRAQKKITRPCDARYYFFKDMIRINKVDLPDSGYHVIFVFPMPKWTEAKRNKMRHTPRQSTPDIDNILKALLDSLFKNDAHIWDGRVSKMWGDEGRVIIITGIDTTWIPIFLNNIKDSKSGTLE